MGGRLRAGTRVTGPAPQLLRGTGRKVPPCQPGTCFLGNHSLHSRNWRCWKLPPEHEPELRLPLEADAGTPPGSKRETQGPRLPLYPVPPPGSRLPANKGLNRDFSFERTVTKGEMAPCGGATEGCHLWKNFVTPEGSLFRMQDCDNHSLVTDE